MTDWDRKGTYLGGDPVTIAGHPLAVAPGFSVTVSRSSLFRYRNHGISLEVSGKNGFSSPFACAG